jgi:membrane associated rhomboid family serine protease
LSPPPASPQEDRIRLQRAFRQTLIFTALLWLIKIIETVLHLNFARYGVYPLDPGSLTGILTGPLIHGSWSHLFANTLPVIILGTVLLYGYP